MGLSIMEPCGRVIQVSKFLVRFRMCSCSSPRAVWPDFAGAVLNGTGAISWWIDEIYQYSKRIAVSLSNKCEHALFIATNGVLTLEV